MEKINENEVVLAKDLTTTLAKMSFDWKDKGVAISWSLNVYNNKEKEEDFVIIGCNVQVKELDFWYMDTISTFNEETIADFLKKITAKAEKFSNSIVTERKNYKIEKIAQLKEQLRALGEE